MAALIGGISCDFLKGEASGLKQRVQVWQVPGINGYGALTLGTGDSGFSFRAIKYGSISAVNTFIASVEALQATIISATDDWGTAHTNLLVSRVGTPSKTFDLQGGGVRCEILVGGVITA